MVVPVHGALRFCAGKPHSPGLTKNVLHPFDITKRHF